MAPATAAAPSTTVAPFFPKAAGARQEKTSRRRQHGYFEENMYLSSSSWASEENNWGANTQYPGMWSGPAVWKLDAAFAGWACPTKKAPESGPMINNVAGLFAPPTQVHTSANGTNALTVAGLLGEWADSLGNKVQVISTDAYQARLLATLSRPSRKDIHLKLAPVAGAGSWQCGNSTLDPYWSSLEELHWVAGDGRVSVWVRPGPPSEEEQQNKKGEGDEVITNKFKGKDDSLAAADAKTA